MYLDVDCKSLSLVATGSQHKAIDKAHSWKKAHPCVSGENTFILSQPPLMNIYIVT